MKTLDLIASRSVPPEVILGKGVLKICSKFTEELPCQNLISIKLQSNFTEITLRHGRSPVNLLHIFRTTFPKSTFGWLILSFSRRKHRVQKFDKIWSSLQDCANSILKYFDGTRFSYPKFFADASV